MFWLQCQYFWQCESHDLVPGVALHVLIDIHTHPAALTTVSLVFQFSSL